MKLDNKIICILFNTMLFILTYIAFNTILNHYQKVYTWLFIIYKLFLYQRSKSDFAMFIIFLSQLAYYYFSQASKSLKDFNLINSLRWLNTWHLSKEWLMYCMNVVLKICYKQLASFLTYYWLPQPMLNSPVLFIGGHLI